jgi:serine/threonine-protein kinase
MSTSSQALREIFEEALALDPAARPAFYAERGLDAELQQRIERMIEADAEDDVVLDQSVDAVARAIGETDETHELPPGTRIGPFHLLEVLGEGGSSTVFRAERIVDGVRQVVALKLLRRALYSKEAQRQFRRERLALAQLRHPGIARLIEGGVTDAGLGYIAIDLVDGMPITDHAKELRLDLRARLKLFLQVCRAVEAAHRALIVHRDLKPSNVLVTADGEVKLLDFGIAKLLAADDETQTRLPAFTPAYAAPEQRTGAPITTATDVYALGVLLGELVTGQRLNDGSSRTPSATVSEESEPGILPAPPAITRRQLRGDLDNVVLKAIAAEPVRRYASASALADDIERLLDQRPVAAHPPSTWYRAPKFVARHRGGVALTAMFVLGIVAALGLALWQGHIARRSAERADAMRDFMISAFSEAEPSTPRAGPPTIDEVVQQAIVKARDDPGMNPGVRSELVSELGAVLRAQGRTREARDTLQWNYDRAAKEFGKGTVEMQRAGRELADAEYLEGDYVKSRELIDALLADDGNAATPLAAELYFLSARIATKEHALKRAVADAEQGLRIARARADDLALANALSEYGNVELSAGDVPGAEKAYVERLALLERRFGPDHIRLAEVHADLSRVYRRLGRLDDAEKQARAAIAIDDGVLPKEHWKRANHLNALMMVQLAKRDYAGALASAEETLRIERAIYAGERHPEIANDLNSVGMMHALLEDFAGAVEPLRDALAESVAIFGAEHFETAVTRSNYGVVLARSGDVAGGEAELLHAIASLEALPDADYDEQAATWEKLARVRLDRGDTADALPAIDRIDALLVKLGTPGAYWDGRAGALRAAALLQQNEGDEALRVLDAASAALAASTNPDAVLRVEIPLLQANAARAAARDDDARRYAETGLKGLGALPNAPHRVVVLAEPFATAEAP